MNQVKESGVKSDPAITQCVLLSEFIEFKTDLFMMLKSDK